MTTLHSPAWKAKVQELSAVAHAKLDPSLHSRIEMATAICLHRMIDFDADGDCHVLSSDKRTWYAVNGTCDCEAQQYHAPGYQCKHLYAKRLALKAQELCTTQTAVEAPRSPQVPRSARGPLGAAPDEDDPAWTKLGTTKPAHTSLAQRTDDEKARREKSVGNRDVR